MSLAGNIPGHAAAEPLLLVRDLKKHYPIREGAFQRVVGHVRAVDGVSLHIEGGKTLGLVGESGCGKTTLGRCVSGLQSVTSGAVEYGGLGRIDGLDPAAYRRFRRNCQMVFQDSFASLNPRHLVIDLVGRPLRVYREAAGGTLMERVVELLEQVGLGRQHLYRYPHQFSGGQRQRISIARALALNPELIVLDEPTSALDVSVQAQILNLLSDLQKDRSLAYLFVTHDLSVVRHMADRLVVMYLGKIAEQGPTEAVFDNPQHPYTKALIDAKPDLAEDIGSEVKGLEGTVPDPARPPQGCRFHTRCPVATGDCGWEVDDVVRWLEDRQGMFDGLDGVERRSEFAARLSFESEAGAAALAEALRSDAVPASMRAALERLEQSGHGVDLAFREVDEVQLTERAPLHGAACHVDPAVFQGRHR